MNLRERRGGCAGFGTARGAVASVFRGKSKPRARLPHAGVAAGGARAPGARHFAKRRGSRARRGQRAKSNAHPLRAARSYRKLICSRMAMWALGWAETGCMGETTIGGYEVLGELSDSKRFRAFRASRRAPEGERRGTL